jgi:hypothetical protein
MEEALFVEPSTDANPFATIDDDLRDAWPLDHLPEAWMALSACTCVALLAAFWIGSWWGVWSLDPPAKCRHACTRVVVVVSRRARREAFVCVDAHNRQTGTACRAMSKGSYWTIARPLKTLSDLPGAVSLLWLGLLFVMEE